MQNKKYLYPKNLSPQFLGGMLLLALALPVTLLLSHTRQIFQQHAFFGDCRRLTLTRPVQLDKETVAVGDTIQGFVSYKNTGTCPFVIKTLAVGIRPPGGIRTDPKGISGIYHMIPELTNVLLRPGQMIRFDAATPIKDGWPVGSGWYAYGAYQLEDSQWVDGDNPNIPFTVYK